MFSPHAGPCPQAKNAVPLIAPQTQVRTPLLYIVHEKKTRHSLWPTAHQCNHRTGRSITILCVKIFVEAQGNFPSTFHSEHSTRSRALTGHHFVHMKSDYICFLPKPFVRSDHLVDRTFVFLDPSRATPPPHPRTSKPNIYTASTLSAYSNALSVPPLCVLACTIQ